MTPPVSDPFLRACGAAGPLELAISRDGAAPRRILTNQAFVLVGSHPRADVPLETGQVALRQLYLQFLGGQVFGVLLDREIAAYCGRVQFSSGWLSSEDTLQIGPYQLRCFYPSVRPCPVISAEDPLTDRLDQSQPHPALVAEVLEGNLCHARWQMNRQLVLVGRDVSARLRLRDRRVSRFHCSLVGTAEGIWVVDLLSREGTRLNGAPVSCAKIEDGDRLQVGCYELRCQVRYPSGASPQAQPSSGPNLPSLAPANAWEASHLQQLTPPGGWPIDQANLLPILQQFGQMHQQMLEQYQQSMLMMMQAFMRMQTEQMDMVREEMDRLRRVNEELQQLSARRGSVLARSPTPSGLQPVSPKSDKPLIAPPAGAQPASASPPRETPKADGQQDVDLHAWLAERVATLEQERQTTWQRIMNTLMGK